jgi:protein-tyrosine phosphatase
MGVGGILHVCTANQIRSPMAERMMVDGLRRQFGDVAESVLVMSAGIRATAGEPMQPRAIDELTRRGIASDGFRSTPLDLGVVGHAHLVLTATRSQRDQLLASVPGALNKTFTWRELAWLLRDVRPGGAPGTYLIHRVVNLAEMAIRRRGYSHVPPPDRFDVADPMGGPKQSYRRAADEIETAIATILSTL